MNRWHSLTLGIVLLAGVGCQPAQDFTTNQGNEQAWSDYSGEYVVVNFFAEWCAPCLKELPELNEFHQLHGEEVSLIGVSYDQLNEEKLQALVDKYDIQFPLMLSEPMPNLPFERPKMLPATYIIKPSGEVSEPLLGEQSLESLRRATGLVE